MRLIGSRVALDALAEHSAPVAQKFLRDLKGAFFKKPPFRVSFMAFSFCFFFFCAYLLKRKRRGRESDETTERVTLRPGGGIWNAPLRSVERHAKQPGVVAPRFARFLLPRAEKSENAGKGRFVFLHSVRAGFPQPGAKPDSAVFSEFCTVSTGFSTALCTFPQGRRWKCGKFRFSGQVFR